ncbi:PAS domain-containing sensor histidine kinase [Ahrensia sp. R2A130]|uniref:sensor histidine kinase NtrY-like n=1 Tax=Ahrensia sp. R2A130 TaxID=744979 RepID=UPI0001E0B45D|nr:PAS domain-containing sensor histidine kinase [Ahrensia sp. R2A130]EFL90138.1 nitrogen regulation protein NtrY [Ahrensia sp. R2A130]
MANLDAGLDAGTPALVFETPVDRLSSLRTVRRFGLGFLILTIIFGLASFVVLLGLTPIELTDTVVLTTVAINFVLIAIIVILVAREVRLLLRARRKGRAAARMHIRIVALFGIVAALPAIIVAVIAGITLDLRLDRIFDERTKSIVASSMSLAESYVEETAGNLNSSTLNMGFLLSRNRSGYVLDRQSFKGFMTGQARARGMVRAAIVNSRGNIVVEATLPQSTTLPTAPLGLIQQAADQKPACGGPRRRSLAGCVVKLPALGADVFLYTLRNVDPQILNSLGLMEEVTEEYRLMESGRIPLQIAFGLLYAGMCLTILLAAMWMGIAVADRLVDPIRRLITAADQVASGDLDVQVADIRSEGELKSLANTFNSMTSELRAQRDEILDNQQQIDDRRRFTEAVLSGVTAGVLGVDHGGSIAIANTSAAGLLKRDDLIGLSLADVSPELAAVVDGAELAHKSSLREQITLEQEGRERTFDVQVTLEGTGEGTHSHVVTIDDITDLVSAQRTSAWADVAQRIAHEIKNPLTPIQLSAERIRRRYGKVITEDREVFDQCTETIVRQVADIGRMVDEFSSFARMPKPALTVGNLSESMREAVFLLKVSNPHIKFNVELGEEPLLAKFDSRLLGQAFGNLIKNATEAIEGHEYEDGEKPEIAISAQVGDDFHIIDIIDNGKGLPMENRARLLEPYMTTREKGTGLGLAIVSKVLEEHGGSIELRDAPQVADGGHGAMVRILVPVNPVEDNSQGEQHGV